MMSFHESFATRSHPYKGRHRMDCRMFGKTGLSVSLLGFGAMRLPPPDAWDRVDMELAVPLLVEAIQAGVNYIDTAWVYCDGQSELAIAAALKQARPGAMPASFCRHVDLHIPTSSPCRRRLLQRMESAAPTPGRIYPFAVGWRSSCEGASCERQRL